MGKKKKGKTKIKETAKAEFKVVEKPKDEAVIITEKSMSTEQDKKEESVPEQKATIEIQPEKVPETINKPAISDKLTTITPKVVDGEQYAETELCMIPCKCLVCGAEWKWEVPLHIGTPILYFRDCKNCR